MVNFFSISIFYRKNICNDEYLMLSAFIVKVKDHYSVTTTHNNVSSWLQMDSYVFILPTLVRLNNACEHSDRSQGDV